MRLLSRVKVASKFLHVSFKNLSRNYLCLLSCNIHMFVNGRLANWSHETWAARRAGFFFSVMQSSKAYSNDFANGIFHFSPLFNHKLIDTCL